MTERVPHKEQKRRMTLLHGFLLLFLLLMGCRGLSAQSNSLPEARRGFKTTLLQQAGASEPVKPAPARIFRTVRYPAPKGNLAAYLSPNPGDGKKHPAIIWITGGDCNSIGDVWSPAPRNNDQTAAAYRRAGIIMMFPSLRGGNDNPGVKEGFLGEVDDILSAASYLAKQSYVDPKRIYLGGHSTGGTLVLLVAEYSNRFRAVFSFGPMDDVSLYGIDSGLLPFDASSQKEVEVRSPGYWINSVKSRVWVFEGTEGNIDPLRDMAQSSNSRKAHFIEIDDGDHFGILAPVNQLLAKKILKDKGTVSKLSITAQEVNRLFGG